MIQELTESRVEVQSTRREPRVWEILHWAGNSTPNHTVLTAVNLPEGHDLVAKDVELILAGYFRAVIPAILMDNEGRLVVWVPVTTKPTHWNYLEAAAYRELWDHAGLERKGGKIVNRPPPMAQIYKLLVGECNGTFVHRVYEAGALDMEHLSTQFFGHAAAFLSNQDLPEEMRR